MDCALMPVLEERRRDTRFSGDALGGVRGTVRPGHAATVVDLSRGGALVEVGRPLRPGGRVDLQFQRGGRRFVLPAHVLRCAVWALNADEGVVYRGALRFENRCDLLWEAGARGANGALGGELSGDRHEEEVGLRTAGRVQSARRRERE